MPLHGYQHARLMDESEARVQMAAYSIDPEDAVAKRVLDDPETYRRWESEHDRLMRAVSAQERFDAQVIALRSTAFSLVHRRAVFDYLRDRRITGRRRRRLFALFYGCRDYGNAVLAEHGNYVRCSSSYVCTAHLGEQLMHDAAFDEPLQLYVQWYAEYFQAYCDVELAETSAEKAAVATLEPLKPLLKYRLREAREAILAMPYAPQKAWREVQIRKPNGDTQKMRAIFGGH